MYGVLDWLLGLGALVLMAALAFGEYTMAFILQGCLGLARKLGWRLPAESPGWQRRRTSADLRGVALLFFLMVGVPVLVVLCGYATGRLPAPSPYLD
jgi:hypothetical protein